jgi:class 3 adenylate cyclase
MTPLRNVERPEPLHRTARILATMLFTDIVGSTSTAHALGDACWLTLLARHHELVHQHVEATGGRVVNVIGDGSLSIFDAPSQAIACAQALGEALRPLGLEIRCGVHTGEFARLGDDPVGVAVHVGARVGALAGAGEIWVTRTVRDLLAGADVELRRRGRHALKGLPGRWHLYSVTARPEAATPDEPAPVRSWRPVVPRRLSPA